MIGTLSEWLRAHDLQDFEPLLVENEVDLKALKVLSESDLMELGLAFGPRKRFLNAIAALKSSDEAGGAEKDASVAPAPAGEHRHLTVMFCDLVGSTTLAERLDSEDLHLLFKEYYKVCTDVVLRYEGYVHNLMGDGLLIYFGWPIAHEDAAERAVRSALQMVEAVKRIPSAEPLVVRIGLATGSVIVGEASRDGRMETGLVVGEIPNLAARLQSLAGPDEVVIAPSTHRLLGNAFALTSLGTHPLKGIAKPVQVWRVDGALKTEGRFEAARSGSNASPLVGRDEESSLLRQLWTRAGGGEGQIVLLGGQAGIGKSRLTQGLRESIEEPHHELLYQCSPYHLNSPLYPFVEQFELLAGFAPDDSEGQRLDKLEAAIVGDPEFHAEVAPLIAALHSLPTDRYAPLQLSPQKQKEKTLEALIAQVETRSRLAPALMLMEDFHWIDPTSEELLKLLISKIRSLPILLILTYRLESSPPWEGQPGVTTIKLDRLERQAGALIVETVTEGKALPDGVLEEILARTDGVPLFVEEMTKSVIESGQLREEGDRYVLDGSLTALSIPDSLRNLLMARLDRLGPAKELAQIGACIGREFSGELLGHVSGKESGRLAAPLETLIAAELVTRHGGAQSGLYRFKHALIQDAAYDSLLKSTRAKLHGRIAQILEGESADRVSISPERVAHHHTQAGNLSEAIPLWRQAGTLAVKRVALREAVAHFQKGLTLIHQLPPSPERDRIELTIREPLNAAWTGLRGWAAPEVGENAAAVLRLAERQDDAQSLMLAMWWVWTSTITQGKIADSEQWVERLLARGRADSGIDLRIFGHSTAMVQHFLSGRLSESRVQSDHALELWEPMHANRWIQLTAFDMRTFVEVYACQLIWIMGYPDQAKRLSDGCVAYARSGGHVFNLVWALTFSAYVFAYRREPETLLERVEEAERLAREQGLAFISEVSVPQAKGIAELQRGRIPEAIAQLRQGIERWTRTGGNVRIPLIKTALAEALEKSGDSYRALELIQECLKQIEAPNGQERLWLAEVLRCKASILMDMDRDEEAENLLRTAIACAREQKAKSWELRSATTLARLLARKGHPGEARIVLSPVYDSFTEGWDTRDLLDARQLLDELSALAVDH
jgi:class 3 adenylate cyclase/tetratricopeptide (TPR) repeat protein